MYYKWLKIRALKDKSFYCWELTRLLESLKVRTQRMLTEGTDPPRPKSNLSTSANTVPRLYLRSLLILPDRPFAMNHKARGGWVHSDTWNSAPYSVLGHYFSRSVITYWKGLRQEGEKMPTSLSSPARSFPKPLLSLPLAFTGGKTPSFPTKFWGHVQVH